MPMHEFQVGDRVEYIGSQTAFLVGQCGTILAESRGGGTKFNRLSNYSLPIEFEGMGYYGCYPKNLKLTEERIPTWEV